MNSGSYQIHIKISKDCCVDIGAIGRVNFKKGKYIYTGSAMKNLSHRVARHRRKDKKIRWHIDYLLAGKYVSIEKIVVFPSEEREECKRNLDLMASEKTEIPVPGFGSSDCRTCPSHLVYIPE